MAARTIKRGVKRRAADSRSAARAATAAKKSASGKTTRPARTATASAMSKPKPKSTQAGVIRSAGGKPPVARTMQYRQGDGWEVLDVADGIAVHDGAFKTVHYLNHTAAIVFLLCKQPVGLDVLCAVFREEFGLKRAPRADIQTILTGMENAGLVRAVPPGGAKAARARPPRKR